MTDCTCWRCLHPARTDEDHLREIEQRIDRHGWLVQAVAGTRGQAPLAYTVGLTDLGLPELLVTGRPPEPGAPLLNAVAQQTLEQGEVRPGEVVHLEHLHVEAVGLPHPDAHLFTAAYLYGPALRAVQLVWADDRGVLPWERGHRGGRGGQPVLGPRAAARYGRSSAGPTG